VARRRERGFAPSLFPIGDFGQSSPYGSTNLPDSERETITETLQGGTVRLTYMDTPESRRRPRKVATVKETAPEPLGPAKVASEVPRRGSEESRFADYPMPGHPRKRIVFNAKL
jgi:hypothetical protein